jgi:two-component system, NarL family, sensor histidine kinase UhpB
VTPDTAEREQRPALTRKLFVANAALLVVAFSVLALTPLSIQSPLKSPTGGLISLAGLGVVLITNLAIIRRSVGPLRRLTAAMRDVDLLHPGTRVPVYGDSREVIELTRTFNDMLDRLESERRESVRRTVLAQEDERLQLARELHDEIGQSLTGLLLQLDYVAKAAPPELAPEAADAREAARGSLEEVRRIARQLRPEALDDLGLTSAITHLADRFAALSGLEIRRALDRNLPPLDPEVELVIYRVAQESMTNVIRHADARRVDLELTRSPDGIRLRVADDGAGIAHAREGAGIKGMRERAVLAGARLRITDAPAGGTEVELDVPTSQDGDRPDSVRTDG